MPESFHMAGMHPQQSTQNTWHTKSSRLLGRSAHPDATLQYKAQAQYKTNQIQATWIWKLNQHKRHCLTIIWSRQQLQHKQNLVPKFWVGYGSSTKLVKVGHMYSFSTFYSIQSTLCYFFNWHIIFYYFH